MKVGILTYHRSHSYGAMLQAVGLLKTLQGMGHEVYFIDYWPKHQSDIYCLWNSDTFKELSLRRKMSYVKRFLTTLLPKILRRRSFNHFFRDHIQPYCIDATTVFDVIIYGSDQIWRKQYGGRGDYNPVYFGINDFKAPRHISYAASMGDLPSSSEDEQKVLNNLEKLDAISVRESHLKGFLEQKGMTNIRQTIDPTMLLDRKSWEMIAGEVPPSDSAPYLLLCDLQHAFDRKDVQEIANARKMKIVELVGTADKMPAEYYRTTDGPYEFLKAIKNASMVLTSSYHGLVFSIIFNKPFYVMFRRNRSRAESLLSMLSMTDRILEFGQVIKNLQEKIDWDDVNKKLNEEIQVSKIFIAEQLQ